MSNHSKLTYKRIEPFIRFCLVGASGIAVNSAVLWLATSVLGVYYLYSGVFATLVSTSWNCLLTELWVFGPESKQSSLLRRVIPFFLLNLAALAMRTPIIAWLTENLHIYYLISNLISLAMLLVGRYLVARTWIWPTAPRPAAAPGD